MGETTSKATQTQFNHTDLQIDQSTYDNISQSCSQTGSASNIVEIIGSQGVKLDANQQNELQQMCKLNQALEKQKNAQAAIDLFTKLSADAEAKGGLTAANSEVNQDIRNQMSAKLDQRSFLNVLQSCTSKSNTDNIVRIVGSKNVDAKVNQVNKALNECILQHGSEMGFSASAEAKARTEADAKAKAEGASLLGLLGLDTLFAGLFGAAMAPFVSSFLVICCCLLFCFLCMSMFMGGGSGGGSSTTQVVHAPPIPPRAPPVGGAAGLFDEDFTFDRF